MQWNIYKFAALLDLELSNNLFFEAFPIDELNCVIRFADRTEDVMVYLKIERFEMVRGGIIMWHGLLAAIPPDYALCDGTFGTPDLRDRFVVGTAVGVDPGGVGGAVNHNHTFTGDGHTHSLAVTDWVQGGFGYDKVTSQENVTGTTDLEDGRPPFYEIAYIMKL